MLIELDFNRGGGGGNCLETVLDWGYKVGAEPRALY
jgi:hypothetical protein